MELEVNGLEGLDPKERSSMIERLMKHGMWTSAVKHVAWATAIAFMWWVACHHA